MSYISQIKISNTVYDIKAKSADWSIIENKPATFPPSSHTHNYLPLTGGTLTGELSRKLQQIDAAHETNNCTTNLYPTTFNILDNQNRIVSRLETVFTANSGDINSYWYVRNYNTSGGITGQRGIKLTINKAGAMRGLMQGDLIIEGNSSTSFCDIREWLHFVKPANEIGDTNGIRWYLNSNDYFFAYPNATNKRLYFGAVTGGTWKGALQVVVTETDSWIEASRLYGAVWNDYAEFRELQSEKVSPPPPYGRVVVENGDDTLSLSTKRLQPGGNICSDTFGFAIGETDKAKMPVAVSGRVLVYPAEDRNSYEPGDALCTGPNGTVSKMTRGEIKEYPDRIIGYVSAVPSYETWGEKNVAVDGRIWVKVA